MLGLLQEKKAQAHQKHQYDKHCKEPILSVGDGVMVYMPHSVSGKHGSWQDPFMDPTVFSYSQQQTLKSNSLTNRTLSLFLWH